MIAQTGKRLLDKVARIDGIESGKGVQVILRERDTVVREAGVVLVRQKRHERSQRTIGDCLGDRRTLRAARTGRRPLVSFAGRD